MRNPIADRNHNGAIQRHRPSSIRSAPEPKAVLQAVFSSRASNAAGKTHHFRRRALQNPLHRLAVLRIPMASCFKDRSLPPSRVTPWHMKAQKKGSRSSPPCISHSNAQRQVKPNVAKNASKSPVVTAPSPSRSAAQSFVSVNSHELSSTFAIGLKLLAAS